MLLSLEIAWLLAHLDQADPIVTDRPDFTESALVVPLGRTQVESGAQFAWRGRASALSGPELLIRRSLDARTELRIEAPQVASGESWGSAAVGFKRQLGPIANGDDLALIGIWAFPTRRGDQEDRGGTPSLSLCWSRELPRGTSLAGMLTASAPLDGSRRRAAGQATLSFAYPVRAGMNGFLELALDAADGASPVHALHVGWTLARGSEAQFDLHLALLESRQQTSWLVGAGYSVRF